jgi:hypothetical protein
LANELIVVGEGCIRENVQRQSLDIHERLPQYYIGVCLQVLDNLVQVPSVVCGVDITFFFGDFSGHSHSTAIHWLDCVSQATIAHSERLYS